MSMNSNKSQHCLLVLASLECITKSSYKLVVRTRASGYFKVISLEVGYLRTDLNN